MTECLLIILLSNFIEPPLLFQVVFVFVFGVEPVFAFVSVVVPITVFLFLV